MPEKLQRSAARIQTNFPASPSSLFLAVAGVLTVLALLVLIKHTDLPGGQVITIYGSKAGELTAPGFLALKDAQCLPSMMSCVAREAVVSTACSPCCPSGSVAVPPSYPNADLSPELRGLLAAVAINRTVVAAIASNISISDDPKFGTLHLLVESAQRANVSNLFVAAYDQVTLDWLVAHGVPALLRQMPTNCDKALHWVMCAKGDLARDVVALDYNLLALDTDVLFFRNPLEGGLDGSFDVESSSDAMNEKLQCSRECLLAGMDAPATCCLVPCPQTIWFINLSAAFGSSRTASEEGYPYLQSMCIAQVRPVRPTSSRYLDSCQVMKRTSPAPSCADSLESPALHPQSKAHGSRHVVPAAPPLCSSTTGLFGTQRAGGWPTHYLPFRRKCVGDLCGTRWSLHTCSRCQAAACRRGPAGTPCE